MKTKFCLSLHRNHDTSYLFVNGKGIYKFKAENKTLNFSTQFCLRSISNKFDALDSREVSLKENVYNFSIDYDTIDTSNILKFRSI